MRLLAVTVLALTFLLTACAAPRDGNSSGDNLSTSETQFYSFRWLLPLPVSTNSGDTLYASAIWGIEIVEILADGNRLAGKPSYILLDDLNIGPITVHSGTFIYNVNLSQMVFGKLSKPFNYSLVEYSIPEDTELLKIRYRLVTYDGEPDSRVYTVEAFRVG